MDQLQLSPPSDPVEIPWERSQVRVPREDGGLLAIPNLCDAPEAAVRNREHRAYNGCQILGVPLKQFRQHACDESLVAAERYTSRILGRDCGLSPAGPLIATGHQPDLFHPGVWVKQYAASELARRCNGVGLNLIVDSDMMRSHRIRVPVGMAALRRTAGSRTMAGCPDCAFQYFRVVRESRHAGDVAMGCDSSDR